MAMPKPSVAPQIYLSLKPLVLVNVTLLGDRVFIKVIKMKSVE